MSILTNPRVGMDMRTLELLARRGDPWAQAELERQCFEFARAVHSDSKMGMDLQERNKLLTK
ncbi:hypothetical protein [Pantoea phage Nufs112]|nr:hypothetical protein [Pantoea phage Nufs112]